MPAFRFFTRATPGLPDLLLLGKIRDILRRKRSTARGARVDLVVLDAPATGHALSLVALPRTLLAAVPAGPVRKLAEWLDALLSDPKHAALVVVSEPEDFAAKETEELIAGAREKAGLATALVVVNRVGRGGKEEREELLLKKERERGTPLVEIPEIEDDEFEEHQKISSNGPVPNARGERNGNVAAQASQFFSAFLTTFEENLHAAAPSREDRPKRAAHARAPESRRIFSPTLDLRPWLDEEKLIVLTGTRGRREDDALGGPRNRGGAPRAARARPDGRSRQAPRAGPRTLGKGGALRAPHRSEGERHPEGRPSLRPPDRPEGDVRAASRAHGEPRGARENPREPPLLRARGLFARRPRIHGRRGAPRARGGSRRRPPRARHAAGRPRPRFSGGARAPRHAPRERRAALLPPARRILRARVLRGLARGRGAAARRGQNPRARLPRRSRRLLPRVRRPLRRLQGPQPRGDPPPRGGALPRRDDARLLRARDVRRPRRRPRAPRGPARPSREPRERAPDIAPTSSRAARRPPGARARRDGRAPDDLPSVLASALAD